MILIILDAVAIPRFSTSAEEAKTSRLQSNRSVLRNATEYYKPQHRGVDPGYPAGGGTRTETAVIHQMNLASKSNGSTAALGTAGCTLGPHSNEAIPEKGMELPSHWTLRWHMPE